MIATGGTKMELNPKQEQMHPILVEKIERNLKLGYRPEVDMHIHSQQSDGLFNIEQIIYYATLTGLKKIFITDHNTCLPGLQELEQLCLSNTLPIEVEIGSEIACKIPDINTGNYIPIEILSYYADPYEVQRFLDLYSFSKVDQEEQLSFIQYVARQEGLQFNPQLQIGTSQQYATELAAKDFLSYPENKAYFMKKAPMVWTSPKLFYKKLFANPNSPFYFDTTKNLPTYQETIQAIQMAGGIPILAHPCLYIYQTKQEIHQLVDTVCDASQICGVEANHSAHTIEQRMQLSQHAIARSRPISGGTDFHSGPQTMLGVGRGDKPLNLKTDMLTWHHIQNTAVRKQIAYI